MALLQKMIRFRGADMTKKTPVGKIEPKKMEVPSPVAPESSGSNSELSMNRAEDWQTIRQNWAQNKLSLAHAYADKFFMSDEEVPLHKHYTLMIVALFFLIFVAWANWATVDEITRGEGKVIPSDEIKTITTLEGGIVDEFLVSENDVVKSGDVLMRLRDVDAASDLGSNRARYLGLLATISRLQAEAEGVSTPNFPQEVMRGAPSSVTEEMNAFRANRNQVQRQLNVLEQQEEQRRQEISELETKISDLRKVIALSRDEMKMIEPLVKRGSAPELELLQLKRGLQEKQTELNGALQAVPRAESALKEAQARKEEMVSTARATAQTELSAKLIEMNAIKETLASLEDRKTRTEIRSPVDGTIKDFKINTVGAAVRPGADLIEIVPQDDQLLVEAKIRPSDIAFLYPTQEAVIKITAYDYSIYGGLTAKLVDISADTIENQEGESFYRVRLRTDENELRHDGKVLPIKPGMVASVDILTGKKTIMNYLLKPFNKTLTNAFHER